MFPLPKKTPTEKKVVTFPFGTEAVAGAILSAPIVDKSLLDSNAAAIIDPDALQDDASAALLNVSSAQVQGTDVLVLVEAGKEANVYGLLCTVAADNGEVHQLAASLEVTQAAA